jgi:protein-L-isoaspartate(D-aspartate) O-methyltransferase
VAADGISTEVRTELIVKLRQRGALRSQLIAKAMSEIPREQFIRKMYRDQPGQPGLHEMTEDGIGDRRQWLELVYADQTIVTSLDTAGLPYVSSTAPWLMAMMLESLDLAPGQRVLEIGTGTGYNAALLARAVGDPGLVTTVDIDCDAAGQAKEAIERTVGRGMVVLCGDGKAGAPLQAPFDRIVATAGCALVPAAWLSQLNVHGRLVLCLQGSLGGGVTVVRRDRGGTAHGDFLDLPPIAFIPMRSTSNREGRKLLGTVNTEPSGTWTISATDFDPESLLGPQSDFRLLLQYTIRAAETSWHARRTRDGQTHWVLTLTDRAANSSLQFHRQGSDRWMIEARGDPELWHRVLEAYDAWCAAGKCGISAYQLAIEETTNEHRLRLLSESGAHVAEWILNPATKSATTEGPTGYLRRKRGGQWASFKEVADHLDAYAIERPEQRGVVGEIANFLADVDDTPHSH